MCKEVVIAYISHVHQFTQLPQESTCRTPAALQPFLSGERKKSRTNNATILAPQRQHRAHSFGQLFYVGTNSVRRGSRPDPPPPPLPANISCYNKQPHTGQHSSVGRDVAAISACTPAVTVESNLQVRRTIGKKSSVDSTRGLWHFHLHGFPREG